MFLEAVRGALRDEDAIQRLPRAIGRASGLLARAVERRREAVGRLGQTV
jgi:hypothetical protein